MNLNEKNAYLVNTAHRVTRPGIVSACYFRLLIKQG